MSTSLTNVQQTEFDALVKVEYRSSGFKLKDTVRIRTDITGNVCQFRKIGQVIANATGYQNTVAIQDPGFNAVLATLTMYTAATACSTIQELTVNFDSKRELAMIVAMAIGRRSDQIILDAMESCISNFDPIYALANNDAAGNAIPGSRNMTYSKLRNVIEYFDRDAVPVGERFVVMSGNNLRNMLQDDHIVSRFYTSNDAAVTGNLNYQQLLGLNIRILPDMTEGGIRLVNPKTDIDPAHADKNEVAGNGTIRSCFAWHKNAVGMAVGQDMRTEITYLPREVSYFINGIFFAGSTVIDNRGFFRVRCDESDVA